MAKSEMDEKKHFVELEAYNTDEKNSWSTNEASFEGEIFWLSNGWENELTVG